MHGNLRIMYAYVIPLSMNGIKPHNNYMHVSVISTCDLYCMYICTIREKAFREMKKKDVGMTTAQKSKETRRMEMGSIFVLYIQPTIPTYTSGSFRL